VSLTFNEELHEYRVNGRIVPSVTQILAPLIDYSHVPPAVLEQARQLGSAVHRMTELEDQDDLDIFSVDEGMLPYLKAWRRFKAECNFLPASVEERAYHPALGYCGTWDRTGFVCGRMAVIDIKKMDVLPKVVGIQLAAYQQLHNLNSHSPVVDRYALGLRKDGSYRLQAFTDESEFSVFVSLLTIHNWKRKHGNH